MSKTVKIVMHDTGKVVVNMPGTGMRPWVCRDVEKGLALARNLLTGNQ